jgi:DNA replication and repair protein RecF
MFRVYDDLMVKPATRIFARRAEYTERMIPIFRKYYHFIAPEHEDVDLQYNSQLEGQDFPALLNNSREKDRIMQYTTQGIHKDDRCKATYPAKTGSQEQNFGDKGPV